MAHKLGKDICDRCKRCIGPLFTVVEGHGGHFISKMKGTKMQFCDKQCKLIFLKGKKYWNKKTALENKNFQKLMHDSCKCL